MTAMGGTFGEQVSWGEFADRERGDMSNMITNLTASLELPSCSRTIDRHWICDILSSLAYNLTDPMIV